MAQSSSHLAVVPKRNPEILESGIVPLAPAGGGPPRGPLPRTGDVEAPRIALRSESSGRSFAEVVHLAESSATSVEDMGRIWLDVTERRLAVCGDGRTSTRRYVIARRESELGHDAPPLEPRQVQILVRILCGEQQKHVAPELEIACSTASKWHRRTLEDLGLVPGQVPLPLVLAAQSSVCEQPFEVDARSATFHHDGAEMLLLSVPLPRANDPQLTATELDIARLLVDGVSRVEIAERRGRSDQTVACQIRAIHLKLGLKGRFELIAYAARAGWFR
jgi:DNA-binding NarL/FixJ family response regulator